MRIDEGGGPPQYPVVKPPAVPPAKPQSSPESSSAGGGYYRDAFERLPPPPPTAPPVNLARPPTGSGISFSTWHHLPPEDRQAVWDDYLRSHQTGAAGVAPLPASPTNPALASFLGQHPDMATNQDFIDYFWKDEGGTGHAGWEALVAGCAGLGLKPADVTNYRSAAIRDLAYPPAPPDGSLPLTAEAAKRYHLVEFTDPTYNPTGPGSSVNCGPAALAMALDTQGLVPPGLTPEQRIDYARGLMFGTSNEDVVVQGRTVHLLDQDHETTDSPDIEKGAEAAGLTAQQETGWKELDAALAAGKPIVAFGDCYPAWKKQFPTTEGRYGSGEIAHFISIVGKTAAGGYVVCDPMFTGGPVEMTRDQLAVFFSKGGDKGDNGDNTPGFVSMDPVKATPSPTPLGRYPQQIR
jgi:hypothetical protein